LPICQKVPADSFATASLARSLTQEVRELHKLAVACRAASLALFRNSAKHPAVANIEAPARGGKRVLA
jgi:hypothetical protein